jgi:hypothetical protein
MTEYPKIRDKADILRVLARSGIASDVVAALDRDLPDSVDVDTYGAVLDRYGVTHDDLISRMGGSP